MANYHIKFLLVDYKTAGADIDAQYYTILEHAEKYSDRSAFAAGEEIFNNFYNSGTIDEEKFKDFQNLEIFKYNIAEGVTAGSRRVLSSADFNNYKPYDLLFLLAMITKDTTKISKAYSYFKKFNPDYKKFSEMNQNEYNSIFTSTGNDKLWSFLNPAPFAIWDKIDGPIKEEISNEFLFYQILIKYSKSGRNLPDLPEVYNFLTSGNKITFESYPAFKKNNESKIWSYSSDGGWEYNYGFSYGKPKYLVYMSNPVHSAQDFDIIIDQIYKSEFISKINSAVFLSFEQIDVSIGRADIIEDGQTAKIEADEIKKISEAAKTDNLFNIFAKGFIKGQNEKSEIVTILRDLIDSGIIFEEETKGPVLQRVASAALGITGLGVVGLTALFDNDENQDFNDKLSQCIILTALKDFAKYSVQLRKTGLTEVKSKKKWHYPYGGRIYCVDTNKPNTLINILSSPNGMHRYIKTLNSQDTDTKENLRFNFQLYKIVEEDGVSKEYPFLFEDTPDETGKKPIFTDLLLNAYQDSAATPNTKRIIEKKTFGQFVNEDRTGMNNKLQIVDMSIGIKGETVATVRSNIDVTINFSMPSLDIIMAKFEANSRYKKKDGSGDAETYEFSFSELLSHNVGSKTGLDGTNASRILNTSYLPKKNRLVMKIFPEIKNPNALFKNLNQTERQKLTKYIENSGMVLDLLLVNYDAKRTKPVEDDTISITFKGFTKSFLNEPFCDVIATPALRQKLLEKEVEVVEELETIDTYCDIKEVRTRIQDHYKEMKTLRDSELEQGLGKNKILEKLVERNKLFSVELSGDVIGSLNDNIEKDTQKIIDAGKLATLLKTEDVTSKITPTISFDRSATEDIRTANKIDFFYFGDLIDAYMDVIYGDPQYYSDAGIEQYRKRDQFRNSNTGKVEPASGESNVSEIRNKFANFPLKVIMPTFLPIVLKNGKDGKQSFVTSTDPNDKISVADVPISVAYFQNWYEEEVSRRKTKMYPLGSLINRLLNSLVNNVISDSCYTIGNIEKKYFSIKTDFGAPTKKGVFDEDRYNKNLSVFDFLRNAKKSTTDGAFVRVNSNFSPLLKKLKNVERNKHINYLIIYEQFNSFPDMKALDPQITKTGARTGLDNNDIPQFKQNYNDRASGKTSDFVQSMTFSKTDLPFGEEIRFYNDGLNELSTISAVHDCELETLPLLTMFPGMLSWVDPSFVDGTEIYGSIPWTMGIGGFHITYEVNHKANVESSKLTQLKTSIKTKFVDTGSRGAEQSYVKKCKNRKRFQKSPKPEGEEKP